MNCRATTSFDENCVTRRSNHVIDTQPPRIRPILRGNPALYPSRNPRQLRINRLLNRVRTRASNIRRYMPHVQDVNEIDKWSRLCFPTLFLLFNAAYWPYYMIRPQTSS
jgi:hypothetical protein